MKTTTYALERILWDGRKNIVPAIHHVSVVNPITGMATPLRFTDGLLKITDNGDGTMSAMSIDGREKTFKFDIVKALAKCSAHDTFNEISDERAAAIAENVKAEGGGKKRLRPIVNLKLSEPAE